MSGIYRFYGNQQNVAIHQFHDILFIMTNVNKFPFQVLKSSVISAKIGNEIANRVGAVSYVECSSLTGEGMDDLAREIVAAAHHKKGSNCAKPVTCCNCEIL